MKILVVKTHAFGDSLLATPAVAGLIAAGDRVTVLTGPSSLPVWKRMSGIEGLVQSPAPCSAAKLLWWSLLNMQRGFDRVIHLGSSAGAFRWLGFLTGKKALSGGDRKIGFGIVRPAARDYCRIAGVQCSSLKPIFPVARSEFDAARRHTGSEPYVVLAPGGARNVRDFVPLKRWPMSRWAEVSLYLQAEGCRVFLVGGEQDKEEISSVTGINLAGRLSWGETAALVSGASLFSGNDSGPAHLAVAGDTPALVLFGPTDPDSLYEKGSIVPVCGTVSCSPCYANSVFPGCTGDEDCMISIDTERVIHALEEMLQR
ncbi:MAG: glycosyltransferase family 9 protein [Candidatus Sabulitectum sp.]|nr:glycosyltransferase family 9 protein [Candidatus Sabulitectum sp.]